MEAEKRKRSEKESEERSMMKKRKEEKESEERSTMKKRKEEIATDAEVEEFFAILRRMQVAVKYFGEGWRAAVETETEAATADKEDDDDDKEQEVKTGVARGEEEAENVNVLDLNAAPEGESHVSLV